MINWNKPLFQYPRSITGWTVVEVLIGLTAVAVIFLLTAPGINTLSQIYYQNKTASKLLSSLTMAQEEAVRRGGVARMCPSSDGSSCRLDGNWNRGWIVFLDSNASHAPEAIEILDRHGPPNEKIRIQAQGAFTVRATFDINGIPKPDNGTQEGIFKVCFASGEPSSRDILVNQEGWIEVKNSDLICSEA